jgi:predicted alpha/beta hydrolase family esterase
MALSDTTKLSARQPHDAPLVLFVPGHEDPGPADWMRAWESERGDCQRVDLGMWDSPRRNTWVNKLNLAIHHADRPVVLIAEDIGCLAVAWWAEYEQPSFAEPVIGAIFVSPPDVDRPGSDPRLARFGSCPRRPLPFPSYLVADRGDTVEKQRTARQLAADWGAGFSAASFSAGNQPFDHRLLNRLSNGSARTNELVSAARPRDQATVRTLVSA